MIKVGEKLPDFILKDQDNKPFSTQEMRGKRLLLSFHPLAWTPICTNQMKALEAHMETFSGLNTVPVGMSIDHLFSKSAWAKDMGIKHLRMPADFWPHGGVAKSMGVFREKEGFTERINIIADEEGTIIFVKLYEIPQLPDIDEVINFLQNYKK